MMYDECRIKPKMSKWMNDANDAEDEIEQRRRAQSSDHSLCSDTKMMQDRRTMLITHRTLKGGTKAGRSYGELK